MQRGTVTTIASIIFIGAASAFVLLRSSPEYMTVTSEDGNMTVRGFLRAGDFVITQEDGTAYGIPWAVYRVSPETALHDLPVQIRMPEASAMVGTAALARYNDALGMWEWVPTETVDSMTVATTTRLGVFLMTSRNDVTAPDFVTVYDALRDTAPQNAVGYRIAVGYSIADDTAVFRLDDAGQQGGCGGAVQPGNDTAYATSTRTASVLVNDVQTAVTFTFVASWYTVDGGSCLEGTSFQASDEYGILPSSQ